ncbi:hypothetical protein F5B22DRAFT_15467 [Xylaria bambusicola]|uniref:uncharacterized protein n=1 Tax=Xylaria bambusicola TaxID=326684 RepID=UPI0020084599|nr:uncharacterized protein F5B22DRAFT_15467 [Xylaria bambusicola]KAI0528006.1 hypothetical protein F5B22DRAFT_15467 [Xylaria bambusicola]
MSSNTPFTLEANPGTDIWRKPPTTNVWNAPISRTSTGLLKKFQSARVTFWASWTERYDQAGLLLVPRSATSTPPTTEAPEKWVKTGIEFYENQPQLSTVGCDRWADWSVSPLTRAVDPEQGVTLEARREGDENGRSVWVYQLVLDKSGEVVERLPLREICWILADEDEEQVLDVSPLVARPERNTTSQLSVEFKEFSVVWD